MGNQELLPGLSPSLRGAFPRGQERDAQRLSKVILVLVVCIGAISVQPATAGQCKGEMSHALAIVHMTRSYGELNGYPVHRGDDLYREPEEVLALRGLVAPKMLSSNNSRSTDAYILAHRHGKAVHGVLRVNVQHLYRFGQLEENIDKQKASQMEPSVESTFAEHVGHKPGASDEAQSVLKVSPKLHSCDQRRSDDFGIAHPSIFWFNMPRKFEKIVKKNVNCYCFFYHNPSGLMGSAKPKSEGFFLKANILKALYQQDKELFNSYTEFILASNLN